MIFSPLPTPWGRKNCKTHSTILDIVCPYFQKEYFAFLCRLVILFMLCNASIAAGAAVVFNLPVRILRSRLFCALQKIFPFGECVAEFSFFILQQKSPGTTGFRGFEQLSETESTLAKRQGTGAASAELSANFRFPSNFLADCNFRPRT